MADLMSKTALVTGGGTGIGFGIAAKLMEANAQVTIAGRREDVLEEAAERLEASISSSGSIKIVCCDVTDVMAVKNAVEFAANDNGALVIAVAYAGIGAGGPFLSMTDETLRSVLEVNVIGAFNTIQASAETMRSSGGSIIAISSIAGALGGRFRAAYASSKACLLYTSPSPRD